MSEAWGGLIIRTGDSAMRLDLGEEDHLAWTDIVRLARACGIEEPTASSLGLTFNPENVEFWLEDEPYVKDGYLVLPEVFGDAWMDIAKALLRNGKGIELYGNIFHEHGYIECYALNAAGEKFFEVAQDQSGDFEEAEAREVQARWMAAIPNHIKSTFADVLDDSDDDGDDDDD
jgi:hypothetical protein